MWILAITPPFPAGGSLGWMTRGSMVVRTLPQAGVKLGLIYCAGSIPGRCLRIDTIHGRQANSFAACEDRPRLSHHISRRQTLIADILASSLDSKLEVSHSIFGFDLAPGFRGQHHSCIQHAREILVLWYGISGYCLFSFCHPENLW